MDSIRIGDRWVGPGHPCFIIAEAGVNHNGDLDLARRLVDAAAAAGADAVKFQTFRAERVVSRGAPKAEYQKATTSPDESQLEMLRRLELSPEAHRELAGYARERGILFLSTPHDQESIDLLADLGVPAFKVGSGDLTNLPYLRHLARKGRPILLSTGMATLGEVEEALAVIFAEGNREVVLLHAVSSYPAPPEDCNLRAMGTLAAAFRVPVGFSDHTLGLEVALAAVALGACVIEKHLTLDRSLPGPDHKASLEPEEFRAMVEGIRRVERALGDGVKRPAPSEENTRVVARKSLVAATEIPPGTRIRPEMVAVKRPGTGLPPRCLDAILGRETRRGIPADQPITWEDLR